MKNVHIPNLSERSRSIERRDSWVTHCVNSAITLLLACLFVLPTAAFAGSTISLKWDAVADSRVAYYEIQYGSASGQYDQRMTTTATTAAIEVPNTGTTYYFAARACDASGTNCSTFSNEIAVTSPVSEDDTQDTALAADFSASTLSGHTPLTVTFSEQTSGVVTDRAWDFGDGGTSVGRIAVHTYSEPGVYTVSLTVEGPSGASTETKAGYIRVEASDTSGTSSENIGNNGDTVIDSRSSDAAWQVAEIYVATMAYAPDDEGLQYWVEQLTSNSEWTPTRVAQSFFDQPLVQDLYPETQDAGVFVESLYLNIFGRPVDDDGYAYWVEELESGRVQRNEMIIALIEGGWANPDADTDMARFSNLVEIALAFAEYQANYGISYSALTPTEQAYLRQIGREVFEGVTADTSTRDQAIDSIASLLSPLL